MNKKIPFIPAIGIICLVAVVAGTIIVLTFLQMQEAVKRITFARETQQLEQKNTEFSDRAGWQTYRNEDYDFEFKYPLDWSVDNEKIGTSILLLRPPSHFGCFNIFTIETSKEINLEDYLNEIDDARFNISDEKEIDILGGKAIQRKENLLGAGQTGEFLVTYFKKDNLIFKFSSCGTEHYLYNVTEEDIKLHNQILSTFRFIDKNDLSEQVESCQSYECILQIAIENNYIALCENNSEFSSDYYVGYRCGRDFALHHNNSILCEQLSGESVKEQCYYGFFGERNEVLNPDLCNDILNERGKKICNFYAAETNNNVQLCKGSSGCVLNLVSKTKNPELCNEIKDVEYREFCDSSFNIDTSEWIVYANEDVGYEIKYPEGESFFTDPEIASFECNYSNFPEECPNKENIVNIFSVKNLIINLARGGTGDTEEKVNIEGVDYCLLKVYQGAGMGKSYTNQYYTTVLNNECVSIYFSVTNYNCGALKGGIDDELINGRYQACVVGDEIRNQNIKETIISTLKAKI